MTDFLLLAWQLIDQAETARDRGAGEIVRRSEGEDSANAPDQTADELAAALERERHLLERITKLEVANAAIPPAAPVAQSDPSISSVLTLLLRFGRFSLKDLTGEMPDPLDLIDLAANLKDVADPLKRQKQTAKGKA